jgi:hypothetical protein
VEEDEEGAVEEEVVEAVSALNLSKPDTCLKFHIPCRWWRAKLCLGLLSCHMAVMGGEVEEDRF